jgi:uncharacterized Fe-S center protein
VSNVYMIDARSRDLDHAFLTKLDMILDAANLDGLFSPGEPVVIKINVGELGNTAYLRPVVIRAVVEKVLSLGSKPLVVESTMFGRQSDLDWFEVATMHGFAANVLGSERTLADSYTGNEGELLPTGGTEMGMVKVARLVKEAKALLVISHVTGHPLAGLSGALVNLGLGCLAGDGKGKIHQPLKPQIDADKCNGCGRCVAYCRERALVVVEEQLELAAERCNGCGLCISVCSPRAITMDKDSTIRFQQRVAEAAKAVMNAVDGRVRCFSFLLDICPQPDDYPFSDTPFVPNLGILMSEDPVAIDKASLDQIDRAPGMPMSAADDLGILAPNRDKLAAIVGVDPNPLIRHAERIDLGRTHYQLMISS